jgi:hypothetical protein
MSGSLIGFGRGSVLALKALAGLGRDHHDLRPGFLEPEIGVPEFMVVELRFNQKHEFFSRQFHHVLRGVLIIAREFFVLVAALVNVSGMKSSRSSHTVMLNGGILSGQVFAT